MSNPRTKPSHSIHNITGSMKFATPKDNTAARLSGIYNDDTTYQDIVGEKRNTEYQAISVAKN